MKVHERAQCAKMDRDSLKNLSGVLTLASIVLTKKFGGIYKHAGQRARLAIDFLSS